VFRNVSLTTAESWIQPISMGFWHHERLDIRNVVPDRSCEIIGRQLYCGKPVVAHGYRAWIVPEEVARLAGRAALENALASGLPLARSAGRDTWTAGVQPLPTR
jgi:colicin import membrane protein